MESSAHCKRATALGQSGVTYGKIGAKRRGESDGSKRVL